MWTLKTVSTCSEYVKACWFLTIQAGSRPGVAFALTDLSLPFSPSYPGGDPSQVPFPQL